MPGPRRDGDAATVAHPSSTRLPLQITLTIFKFKRDPRLGLVKPGTYFVGSVVIAATCLAALLLQSWYFVSRVLEARRSGRTWSSRRARVAGIAFAALLLQSTNLVLMLALSAYVVSRSCSWLEPAALVLGFLQWTAWNTTFLLLVVAAHSGSAWRGATARGSGPALVMDAPLWAHAPKLALWAGFEAALGVSFSTLWRAQAQLPPPCRDPPRGCTPGAKEWAATLGISVAIALYLMAYVYFSWRTEADVRGRPFAETRFARQVFGMMRRHVVR